MQENVTILMSNYNNAEFIDVAIRSVLEQTSPHWELVICDDCSQDDSVTTISSYLGDPRIKLLRNESNRGVIYTLKKMIAAASNDIVGIFDSDDRLRNCAVAEMLKAYAENPGRGFVYSNFMFCDEKLNPVREGFSRRGDGKAAFDDKVSHFKTFRRSIYWTTSGLDEALLYAEDKDLCLKMEEKTDLVFVDAILYDYRVRHNSQSHNPIKGQIAITSHVRALCMSYSRRLSSGRGIITESELLARIALLRKSAERMQQESKLAIWLPAYPRIRRAVLSLMNQQSMNALLQKSLFGELMAKTYFLVCHTRKVKIFIYEGLTASMHKTIREAISLCDYSAPCAGDTVFSRYFDWWSILPVDEQRYSDYQKLALELPNSRQQLNKMSNLTMDRFVSMDELMAILRVN